MTRVIEFKIKTKGMEQVDWSEIAPTASAGVKISADIETDTDEATINAIGDKLAVHALKILDLIPGGRAAQWEWNNITHTMYAIVPTWQKWQIAGTYGAKYSKAHIFALDGATNSLRTLCGVFPQPEYGSRPFEDNTDHCQKCEKVLARLRGATAEA